MAGKIDGVFVELKATVDDAGVVKAEQKITNSAKKIQQAFKNTDTSLSRTNTQLARQSKNTAKSAKSMGGMGRSAGQASIQLQQFTGQVSGGVNPLIAFSQQAADLGIVMGAPLLGSIVGIGAAIGVVLLPELFKSKSALQELEGIAETLGMSLKKSSTGVDQLSESIEKLAAVSAPLARLQIASSIQDAEKKIKIAAQGINDSMINLGAGAVKLDTLNRIGGNVDDLYKKLQNFHNLPGDLGLNPVQLVNTRIAFEQVAERMGITTSQAGGLIIALKKVQKESSVSNIAALESTLSRLNDETGGGSEKLIEFAKSFLPFFKAAREGTDELNTLRMAFSDLFGQLKKPEEAKALTEADVVAKSLTQQVALAKAELNGGTDAARRLALAFELGLKSSGALPESIAASLTELEKVEAQQVAGEERTREELQKTAQLKSELKAQEAKTTSEFEKLESSFGTELEQIESKLIAERELTKAYFLLELEDAKGNADALLAVEQRKADATAAIEKNASDAKARLEQAKKQTTLGYASSTFGALSSLMNTESRKLFEIGKAAAIGQAIVDGYAAVSKTMASVPYPFNVPLAIAQGAASAVQVQGIAKQKFGGSGGGAGTFSAGMPAVRTTDAGSAGGGNQNINISGIDRNSLISGGQLVDTLNQALGDGFTINFAGG